MVTWLTHQDWVEHSLQCLPPHPPVLHWLSCERPFCCYSGTFREDNFQKAIGALTEAAAEAKGRPGAKSGKSGKRGGSTLAPDEKPDIYKIVRMCMERNYDPLIVFSFSKKECENLAKQVPSASSWSASSSSSSSASACCLSSCLSLLVSCVHGVLVLPASRQSM